MVLFMKDSLKITKNMELENTFIRIKRTRESFLMASFTEKVF